MKVLAVDDSPSFLGLLVECLKDFGHKVIEAQNGAEAAKLLDQHRFDMVISDLNMAMLGGFELLMLVRSHPGHESCPFVLLTTEVDPELKAEARRLGATAWMNKPFAPMALGKLISSLEPA